MTNNHSRKRPIVMALTALVLGAGLFVSPRFAQRAYAQESSCTVNCKLGSCTGTGTCTCSCSFWTGSPVCSCQSQSGPPSDNPVQQT